MKNEKRKTPTNRYYELKQKIKKNDCPVYNCCCCLPYFSSFLKSGVRWGGVDVNNVKKKLVQYMHHAFILTVFFKLIFTLHCLVHRHYGFRCVCQLSRWNINCWRFKYCLLAFHLTCNLCIVWMSIYNNKNDRSPIWISSWNKMSS